MSSVVRSVLGVALLLTGASAAMAQSANQPVQTGATTATAATVSAPPAGQPAQAGASTATAATANAPVAAQAKKVTRPNIADNSDPYGGNDPNSTAGARAFFTPQY